MKFGTRVRVHRGGDYAPQGHPGCRRWVVGVLIGANRNQRTVRLVEDDPLSTIQEWSRAGDVGRWSASAVQELKK